MSKKVVLIVAGSDSSGGAGLQADLKTCAALRCYGLTVVTAITAQNTREIQRVEPVAPDVVDAQLRACLDDFAVDAVKIGMLARADTVHLVAEKLRLLKATPVVLDPVLRASVGTPLAESNILEAIKSELLPLCTVVTPNLTEAEQLTGLRIRDLESMRAAARRLLQCGPKAVVVTGGHLPKEPYDLVMTGTEERWLKGPRVNTPNTHGTGCCFSTALAVGLARGMEPHDAAAFAKQVVQLALTHSLQLGSGAGPVDPTAAWGL